jgi:rod shape-determining protein MreD
MLAIALVLCTAAVIQTAVLSRIPFPRATPDLVVIVIVGIALALGPGWGAAAGFAGGLLLDALPPADTTVGRWALVLCLVGYLAGRGSDAVEASAVLPLLILAGCAALADIGYAVTGIVIGEGEVTVHEIISTVPAAVIYDVLLGAFILPLVMRLMRRFIPASTYARTIR